ncbi:unnamed protein product [Dibothriocephalus latus]|uniref:Uncharacterized protein n=1 Tax=Dibothriocephalus latus TaxID=60516 RepID=A0A3P7MPQ5_DIBLA|nr:unnamed protein product [Dibothriocephalus latus]
MKTLLVLLISVCLFFGVVWSEEEETVDTSLDPSLLTVATEEKAKVDTTATTPVIVETTTEIVDATSPAENLADVSTATSAEGTTGATATSVELNTEDDDDPDGWVVVSAEELSKLMDEIEAEGRKHSARMTNSPQKAVTPDQ